MLGVGFDCINSRLLPFYLLLTTKGIKGNVLKLSIVCMHVISIVLHYRDQTWFFMHQRLSGPEGGFQQLLRDVANVNVLEKKV